MMTRNIRALALALALLAAGCNVSKSYPEKTRYAFAAPPVTAPPATAPLPPAAPAASPLEPLRVMMIRAFQPYDGLSLMYKTGESTFTPDYYNTFVASPDRLLTGEVEETLSRSGIFSTVSSVPAASYRYLLEGDLLQLYGDFSDKAKPAAVMSLRFFLIDDADASARVIFQKTYRRSEPISNTTCASLMAGWNKELGTILAELTTDIESAARASHPSPTTSGDAGTAISK